MLANRFGQFTNRALPRFFIGCVELHHYHYIIFTTSTASYYNSINFLTSELFQLPQSLDASSPTSAMIPQPQPPPTPPSRNSQSPSLDLDINFSLHHQLPTPPSTPPPPFLPQPASPLLRLPAELRNQIYCLLLCPSIRNPYHPSPPAIPTGPLHPSLLATCRQIAHEATPLLYAPHTFTAHPSLLTSLPHLSSPARPVTSPAAIAQIRRWKVTVRLDTDAGFSKEGVREFSGAEFLEVRVWQAQFGACGVGVLRAFEGVRGVREARVVGLMGEGGEGFGEWLEGRMMEEEEEEEEGERDGNGWREEKERDLWVQGGR